MKKFFLITTVVIFLFIALIFAVSCEKTPDFSFTTDEISILVGDKESLPIENAEGVEFSSSNEDILTVSDGYIVAKDNSIGLLTATAVVTAKQKDGQTKTLVVKVYKDEDAFIKETTDAYVVFRVKTGEKWHVADIVKTYKEGETISTPTSITTTDGYNRPTKWYLDKEMEREVDFSTEIMGTSSVFYYGEEIIRDGTERVNGAIDLNVEYDKTLNIYVVTGLKYGNLPYENIVIPESYSVDGQVVEIKGIGDNAFYYDYKTADGTRKNTGLQTLKTVDLSYIDYIGVNAFKNCIVLENVTMKTDVKMSPDAFENTQTPYAKKA